MEKSINTSKLFDFIAEELCQTREENINNDQYVLQFSGNNVDEKEKIESNLLIIDEIEVNEYVQMNQVPFHFKKQKKTINIKMNKKMK